MIPTTISREDFAKLMARLSRDVGRIFPETGNMCLPGLDYTAKDMVHIVRRFPTLPGNGDTDIPNEFLIPSQYRFPVAWAMIRYRLWDHINLS